MAITSEQEQYISSILDKSERDLLFEIASGELQGITASAEQKSAAERLARFQRLLHRVPTGPVSEYSKPFLEFHLEGARRTLEASRLRLYRMLCDPATQKPTALVADIATGQVKDIIAGVASALLSQYSTAVAVGLPVAVYLLRNGLHAFCTKKPATL